MNDDLKKFARQFAGAANVAAPALTAGAPADLAAYSKAAFLDPVLKSVQGAGAALTGQRASDEKDAQAAAEKQQAIMNDPSKYQQVRKADGGFAFFDPSGKEIDISQYSKVTGQRRADILKDSENPIDLQYLNDYQNMNDFAQAVYNGDKDSVNAYIAQNPALKHETPATVMQLLMKKYPHMYGVGGYDQTLKNRNQQIFANNPNYLPGGNSGASTGGWRPN